MNLIIELKRSHFGGDLLSCRAVRSLSQPLDVSPGFVPLTVLKDMRTLSQVATLQEAMEDPYIHWLSCFQNLPFGFSETLEKRHASSCFSINI